MAHVAQRATVADLYLTPGKAELIGGRVIEFMATGKKTNRFAGRIFRSLDDYAMRTKKGEAFTDNLGYVVEMLPSGRESFSPDASYHTGPFPENDMKFIDGAPTFPVEVRSEMDYLPGAATEMALKRSDYFAAGTL